jgi:hypothetical protein
MRRQYWSIYSRNRLERRGLDLSGLGYGEVACNCARCEKLPVCITCGDSFTSWGKLSFSRRSLLHGVSNQGRKPVAGTLTQCLYYGRVLRVLCPVTYFILLYFIASSWQLAKNFVPYVQSTSTGSTRPHVTVPVIYDFTVPVHRLVTLTWCSTPLQVNLLINAKPVPSSLVPQGMTTRRLGVIAHSAWLMELNR